MRCVCVCVCVGVGEEVKGEKRSVRDGRSEQGPGGTCRRHQSSGPPDVHPGWAWAYKPVCLVILCLLFYLGPVVRGAPSLILIDHEFRSL